MPKLPDMSAAAIKSREALTKIYKASKPKEAPACAAQAADRQRPLEQKRARQTSFLVIQTARPHRRAVSFCGSACQFLKPSFCAR